MRYGVILGAGRATRLGPLAAQFAKPLITVGQIPMLVRQVLQLRAAGCEFVNVVVSPGAHEQVQNVIDRAGLPDCQLVDQRVPEGPAQALGRGLAHGEDPAEVLVLTADTVLPTDELVHLEPDRAAVDIGTAERVWCCWDSDLCRWVDRPAEHTEYVAVGAYLFSNDMELGYCASQQHGHLGFGGEYQLSDLMNAYAELVAPVRPKPVRGWQDVGDVQALAEANRSTFMSRSFNGVRMTRPGVITKTSSAAGLDDEIRFLESLQPEARPLFPAVYESHMLQRDGDSSWYSMEYVDSPSLAELWLYWPSNPVMWHHVSEELIAQLSVLWLSDSNMTTASLQSRCMNMYGTKLRDRYGPWPKHLPSDEALRLNGRTVTSGAIAVRHVAKLATDVMVPISREGVIHGDPAFHNVLWSLKTGSFKLLDPRGTWGGAGAHGDVNYDLTKIAASPYLTPIMHGLYTLDERPGSADVRIWPERGADIDNLLQPIRQQDLSDEVIELMIVYHLLSSAPLHDGAEARALYFTALHRAHVAGIL